MYITDKLDKYMLESRARRYPCHSNRASSLGHPCLRYLYYERTAWDQKKAPELESIYSMEAGVDMEHAFLTHLAEAGLSVFRSPQAKVWPKFNISGRYDFMVSLGVGKPSKPVLCEVKSVKPHVYEMLDSPTDLNRFWWTEKWLAQIQLYLLLEEQEEAILILLSQGKRPKEIPIRLDLDVAEGLVKKAEAVNGAIAKAEAPERMAWEEGICGRCDYSHVCLPDEMRGVGLEVLDSQELLELLERREALREEVEEYEEIDREIKKVVIGRSDVVCGRWRVTGKWVERTGYQVKDSRYWQSKIVALEKGGVA